MQDGDSPRVPRKPPHQNPSVAVSLNKCRQGKGGTPFRTPRGKERGLVGFFPLLTCREARRQPRGKEGSQKSSIIQKMAKRGRQEERRDRPHRPLSPPQKKRSSSLVQKSAHPPLAVWVALDRGRVCLAIGTPLFPSPKKSCLGKKE